MSGSAHVGRDARGLEVRKALDLGLGYLRKKQVSGRIGARYPVAATSLAGLAVLGAGRHPRDPLLIHALDYLKKMASPSGFISEPERESRMHGHCYAMLFLTQFAGCLSPEEEVELRAIVKRGLKAIERAQSREGGWYYWEDNNDQEDEASVTVCALQALRSAHNAGFLVDAGRVNLAIRYVKRCQLPGGSFCYSLRDRAKTTYSLTVAALSTLNAAGVYDSPELRRGLEHVLKTLEGYPRSPWKAAEEEFEYYANFYAAQTLYQEDGAIWPRWYESVRDHLLRTQRQDGSWECKQFGDEYATATALLILEVPLGYLPIFQR